MAHDKKKKTGIFTLGLVICGCLGLWLAYDYQMVRFTNGVSYVAYPFLLIQNKIVDPITHFFERRYTIDQLRDSVAQLQIERDAARAQVIELSAECTYLYEVQDLAEFKSAYDVSHAVLTQVLLRNFSDQEHYFFVDGGSNQQIEKNMVAVYKNNIIGRVVEVFPRYSKVLLVSDRSCNVAVYCSQSHATGIYAGTNDIERGLMNHVSHLSSVSVGELIISSGDGMIFPYGFALGQVTSVADDKLVYTIVTQPLCDLRTMRHCYIIQK